MKIDCGIVQDLIPSYVDGVCSASSKECVEEHIAECTECRTFLEECRTVEFSAKNMEEKQLDGLRKVKAKIKLQTLVGYGLLLVVILSGACLFTTNFGLIGPCWYYGLFAIALVATFSVTMQGKQRAEDGKKKKVLATVSVAAIIYELGWCGFIMISTVKGRIPLGLEQNEVGPFLHIQSGIAMAVEMAVFGYTMVCYITKNAAYHGVLFVSLTGIFLILAHTAWMGRLSELETATRNFTEITAVLLGIGAVSGLVLWGVERLSRKK